eukprot:12740808-Ditylum_brightwellii.AAC.1
MDAETVFECTASDNDAQYMHCKVFKEKDNNNADQILNQRSKHTQNTTLALFETMCTEENLWKTYIEHNCAYLKSLFMLKNKHQWHCTGIHADLDSNEDFARKDKGQTYKEHQKDELKDIAPNSSKRDNIGLIHTK